jgi:hypothetical protein
MRTQKLLQTDSSGGSALSMATEGVVITGIKACSYRVQRAATITPEVSAETFSVTHRELLREHRMMTPKL